MQEATLTLRLKQRDLDLLQQRSPRDDAIRFGRATTLSTLAECQRQLHGEKAAAEREQLLRDAIAIVEALRAERSDDPNVVRTLASMYQSLSYALQDQQRYAEALTLLDREIALVEPLLDDKDARPRKKELLMPAWSSQGSTHFEAEDFAAAVQAHQRSADYAEQLTHDFPTIAAYVCRLGVMLSNGAGAMLRVGEGTQAEPILRRAIEQHLAALALSPQHAEAQRFLRTCHYLLADCLATLDRPVEAIALAEELARQRAGARDAIEAASILSQLLAREPPLPLPDPAAIRHRAFELLLEAERRGWPDSFSLLLWS